MKSSFAKYCHGDEIGRMIWEGACGTLEQQKTYKMLARKSERKKPLGRYRLR
jgi:hypothetical protein